MAFLFESINDAIDMTLILKCGDSAGFQPHCVLTIDCPWHFNNSWVDGPQISKLF